MNSRVSRRSIETRGVLVSIPNPYSGGRGFDSRYESQLVGDVSLFSACKCRDSVVKQTTTAFLHILHNSSFK
jgi:hypothetical protein